jgi:pimeloyl-ACP methyl ester carboxylesterase
MSTMHMILGGGMSEPEYESLAAGLNNYYLAHITNVQFNVVCYRFTDDVHGLIKANYPTGPLLICGHSYGGDMAVAAATKFAAEGRKVDHLVLFDPVSTAPNAYAVPNTTGWTLPNNVAETVCFYRVATEAPFSGQISGGPNYRNVNYPAGPGMGTAAHHGDAVWSISCYSYIATALAGNSFLPVVNPPAPPVPPPTPLTKTIVSFSVTYSDGTSETHKAV